MDFGVDGFDLGLGPVDRGTWLHQARERNPSGIRVRTGRKKSMASSSRQQEEVPEQEEFGHDFQYDMGYDQMPTPRQMHSKEIPWQLMINEIYVGKNTVNTAEARLKNEFSIV